MILEYGIAKELDGGFSVWFEPITDDLDGFVIRDEDGFIIRIFPENDRTQ